MDDACPICLRPIDNLAILDCCKHRYCKSCILEWMKKDTSCPLCKRRIHVITSDILSSSQYTQFLPDGSYLYSDYNPRRKLVYTFHLEPLPNYEGEIFPKDAKRCSILKEWVTREIETLQPGIDSSFVVLIVIEGLNRYSSRDPVISNRLHDLLGDECAVFIRELECCVNTKAKSLEEFDDCIEYCYPSLAEQMKDSVVIPHSEKDGSADLESLVTVDPKLEEIADSYRKRIQKKPWKDPKRKHHERKKDVEPVVDLDYDFLELYDY